MMDDRLRSLKESFDRTFALPPPSPAEDRENFLAVRVGGDPYVLRLGDLAGLERRTKIAPLPGGAPELLGLAGLRGRLVPVYSLASLLGYGQAEEESAWMALSRSEDSAEPVGLAFAAIEGLILGSRSELHRVFRAGTRQRHVSEVLRAGSAPAPVHGVVSVKSILDSLGAPRGARLVGKE